MTLPEEILSKKFENNNMSKEELGRHGWRVLHMFTLNLPDKLTDDDQKKILMFLKLL